MFSFTSLFRYFLFFFFRFLFLFFFIWRRDALCKEEYIRDSLEKCRIYGENRKDFLWGGFFFLLPFSIFLIFSRILSWIRVLWTYQTECSIYGKNLWMERNFPWQIRSFLSFFLSFFLFFFLCVCRCFSRNKIYFEGSRLVESVEFMETLLRTLFRDGYILFLFLDWNF